jgi:Carboxypeptidase regulatory-like domain
MMRRAANQGFAIAAVALAMLFLSGASNARTAAGNLGGTVLDAQGKPVAGASVVIQTSDGEHPHATRTDGRGHFEFARFATGQYDLRAEFRGANSRWVQRVLIRSHRTTKITLRLTEVPTTRHPNMGSRY